METLLAIGFALLAGLLMSRVVKPLKLPAVTGYLVAGILVGPYCLGRLGIPGVGFTSMEAVTALNLISEVALGFIAFSIGNEFRLSQLRRTGRQAAVIGVVQALAATLMVDAVLYGLHLVLGEEKLPLSVVIILGAIATATAPAATLMVVNQYKAKGPLTDILLPIVALDDAVGLVVFAVSFGIAKAVALGTFSIAAVLANPLIEVAGSLLLGTAIGYIFTFAEKFFNSNSKRLSISITFVILTVALSMLEIDIPGTELKIGFSSLLVCMMLGTIFCNACDFSEELMARCDRWTAPLFVLFFVVSGAELELSVFTDVAVAGIGVAYILSRSAGKYLGAFGSAKAVGCPPSIVRYLGITLLPQAGVALGMTITVAEELGDMGRLIRSIVLFGVLIYELVGPMLTKIALTKAGDIQPKLRDGRSPLPGHTSAQ
ncbi:MAG: sodium:proton antiporter [Oscillospiraceae bacterium]|nr:sodium:proton antiporter [Oscillospiraceae bacterium]